MSKIVDGVKKSIIFDINRLLEKNNYPQLPIDNTPIQGDLSVICFPGAQFLKKSPNILK